MARRLMMRISETGHRVALPICHSIRVLLPRPAQLKAVGRYLDERSVTIRSQIRYDTSRNGKNDLPWKLG
jgi:hypothetical protein